MNFSKQNILIVEDDIETLEIMVEIFESIFFKVFSATDGYEAIKSFEKNKIDVILCDVNIPRINGLDIISKIREINYFVVIIIVSAYSDSNTLLKASNSGIQGYIVKPITSNKVKTILEKIHYHQNHEFINRIVKINDFISLDLLNSQVFVNDEIIKLTNKERNFLNLLFEKKGVIVTYKSIEQVVWYDDNKVMTGTSLRTLVKNIRKKLSCDIIENISKVGYRLIVENNKQNIN